MAERPILFSAPMVRAILEGRKTQTRRVLKPQIYQTTSGAWHVQGNGGGAFCKSESDARQVQLDYLKITEGDTLWVREAWRTLSKHDAVSPRDLPRVPIIGYDADYQIEPNDGYRGKGRPSIHMPRWASRITLKVTGVKVERLHDISEADAIAEGIYTDPTRPGKHWITEPGQFSFSSPTKAFRALWSSINGTVSWEANPWVVAYSFERIS